MTLKALSLVTVAVAAAIAVPALGAGENWLATQVVTKEGAHRVGNPAAKSKVIEFVSYTCPHCGEYFREGDGPMKLTMIQPGKASVEVRHVIRDQVDMAIVALVNCGDPKKFWGNHDMFLARQQDWMTAWDMTMAYQQRRWNYGPTPNRLKAISGDLGFYEMMERRGYSRTQLDQCLGDTKKLTALSEAAEAGANKYGVHSTPSFVVNGKLLDGHTWADLRKALS